MIEPRPEFLDELEANLRARHQALQPRRVVRWRAAAAVVMVMFAASLLIPSVRSFAQGTVEDLFKRAKSDTLPPTYPEEPSTSAIEWVEYDTIEEARAALDDDILLPSQRPDGFTLRGIYGASDGSVLQLDYGRSGRGLLISAAAGDHHINDNIIGATAEIVPVAIKGIEGAYVEGVWGAENPGDDYRWMPNASFRRLRWVDGDVHYEIYNMGGSPGHPGYLSMEDMIALAESLE
ncbi:MAG: hypothetical protein L0154_19535 [Chloroflexi bacterium]|nr:hypothetical protein [Chloroflexota bacterium]